MINSAEEHFLSFYHERPISFWASLILNLASHGLAILEVYLLFHLLGANISMPGALIIEALTKLISVIGAINPASGAQCGRDVGHPGLGLGVEPVPALHFERVGAEPGPRRDRPGVGGDAEAVGEDALGLHRNAPHRPGKAQVAAKITRHLGPGSVAVDARR